MPPLIDDELDELLRRMRGGIAAKFPSVPMPNEYLQLFALSNGIDDAGYPTTKLPGIDRFDDMWAIPANWQLRPEQFELEGWTVSANFQIGVRESAASHLVYCCKKGSVNVEERETAWRIVACEVDVYEWVYFSSIADWLAWRADWLQRLPKGWEDERAWQDGAGDAEEEEEATDP